MYVTAQESRALSRLFGLLAEDFAEREVRERIGHHLLELLSADHYASFVWDTPSRRFGAGVWLPLTLAAEDPARWSALRDALWNWRPARQEAPEERPA